jgi:thiol:disulfide interchange protein
LRIEFEQGGNKMYGPVTQLWVRHGADWRIAAEARSARFYPDAARTLPVPQTPNVELYSDPSRAQAELDEALTRARAEHKRVIAVFGANWCYDCHVLDAAFHSNGLAPLVNANFIVVHISVGDDGRANNDLAARLGVPLDKGVPALAVLDPDGEVVYAQKYGEFEASEKISPSDLRGFLEKWRPIR